MDCNSSASFEGFRASNVDDDGTLFDLDFTRIGVEKEDHHNEFEFDVSLGSSCSTPFSCVSPADDLFCRGKLLPLHFHPSFYHESHYNISSPDVLDMKNKSNLTGLLSRVTKIKVPLPSFNKSQKQSPPQRFVDNHENEFSSFPPSPLVEIHKRDVVVVGHENDFSASPQRKKLLTVKLKINEMVSFFAKESPKREGQCNKKKAKEILQWYIKVIKPLYIKISKKNSGEKKSVDKKDGHASSFMATLKMSYKQRSKAKIQPFTMQQNTSPCLRSNTNTVMEVQNDDIRGAIAYCKQFE